MKYTIDRFEGAFAVIEGEDLKLYNIPSEIVPSGAKKGSIIEINLLSEETEKRTEQLKERLNNLFKERGK